MRTKAPKEPKQKEEPKEPETDKTPITVPEENINPGEQIAEYNHKLINYSDIGYQTTLLDKGMLTPNQFYTAQMSDLYIQKLLKNSSKSTRTNNGYIEILHNNKWKPVLPTTLAVTLINILHFHRPGTHKSKTQLTRDITNIYYIPLHILTTTLNNTISNCHICQIYAHTKQKHTMNTLHRYDAPRLSWSIDLITDLPISNKGNKLLIIAVDDFANYIVAIPIKTASTEDISQGLTNHLFTPFGNPLRIRSDEQPGIYNSTDFYNFLSSLNIELHATAVASPSSNGRAERTIGVFKQAARKYFYQYKCLDKWDEHLIHIITALNTSINTYGHTPEQIMFGTTSRTDLVLLETTPTTHENTNEDVIAKLIEQATTIRQKYHSNKSNKEQSNMTYKNKELQSKNFSKGDLVLHRQLQVSTGTASKWKPLFTGPYVIVAIHNNDHTATCQHTQSGKIIKGHFSNLEAYRYDEHTLVMQREGADEHQLYKK
jgi:transposase InsO family protein